MASLLCLNDDSIGPSVRGCRGDFDFTLKFEKIFLTIIPASVFFTASLPRIVYLWQQPRIVGAPALQFMKLAVITAYTTLQFALLILLTTYNGAGVDSLAIAATALSFVAALSMIALSFFEHSRAPRPSILLTSYILLQLLFDIVQARTSWLVANSFPKTIFARLFTASLAMRVAILFLEAQRKTKWLRWNVEEHSPEETSGVFSLGVYFWLNRLFLRGYRTVLTMDDLYALDHGMLSEAMQLKLARNLQKAGKKGQKLGLARKLAKTLAVPLLLSVAPRVALIGFNFCQPFFINALLDYLQESPEDSNRNTGYGLIGAALLIYPGIAVSAALYWYFHERTLYMSRGCLSAAIYKKTTEARLSETGDAAAVTLMSTDIERIVRGLLNLHECWANLIEISLGCWLLERKLGAAFVAPIGIIILCVVVTSWVARQSGARQSKWMDKIQKRVGLTANVISNMKNLRISGITTPVAEFIQQLRDDELATGSKFRLLLIIVATIAFVPNSLSPVVTYAATSRSLDTSTIFTSFSYLVLLTTPLSMIVMSVPSIIGAFTCLGRIQSFLEAEPRFDFRQSELEPRSEAPFQDRRRSGDSIIATKVDEKQQDNIQAPPRHLLEPGVAISIVNGSFGWSGDKMTLSNLTARIPSSQLTLVVGPVASGKSTFCKVILGEVPVFKGRVAISSSVSNVGFCEQTPFLSNGTLKDNIVGYSQFRQARYDEVIEATMLFIDITTLPQGHETKIGTNGIMLSGGQKQRVALARALYLDSDLFVFDDVLSGLDNDTAREVFTRVFGPNGIIRRRQKTAVLCTHSVRYLPQADHIIALGPDGTLVEEGTFEHLTNNKKYVHSLGVTAADSDSESDQASSTGLETAGNPSPAKAKPAAELLDPARQLGDLKVYTHYFGTISKICIYGFIATGLGWGGFQNASTIWMKYWSEDTLGESKSFYVGIFGLFRVVQLGSLSFSAIIVILWMTTSSGSQLHQQALNTVINAPLSFFTSTDSGIVTNLFSQDMTLIDGELPMALLNCGLSGFECLGMAAVVAVASPYMAISYPVLLCVLYIVQKFYLRTSRQLRLLDLEAKSPLYTHFLDTIKGVATIRAFGWVGNDVAHNQHLLDNSQRPAYLLAMIQQWLALTMQLIVAVLAITLVTLATQQRTNSGFTGASLVTLMALGEAITALIRFYTSLETSIGAVARLRTFSQKVVSESSPGEDIEPPEEWPQRGQIDVKGISASYSGVQPPTSDTEGSRPGSANLALNNITLSIQHGEKVAICGRSGSGKSSLMLLLLRLLDPLSTCSTNMEIDGLPFHRIDRQTLRRRIIAVPQDAVFLPDGSSIKANIDPFNAASDEQCFSVLEAVQLGGFVAERGGLHAGMSEEHLSAGQKQLFSIGRAILRRRVKDMKFSSSGEKRIGGILLLDEVSSSVDQETDRMMQEIIKREFEDYTIVMVSHRLDMVMEYFDRVVVMDKGAVAETGRPGELVDRETSRFAELWNMGKHGSRS